MVPLIVLRMMPTLPDRAQFTRHVDPVGGLVHSHTKRIDAYVDGGADDGFVSQLISETVLALRALYICN